MSEKTAKLNRKEAEKPNYIIISKVFINDKGRIRVDVTGFPNQWNDAKLVMDTALSTVANHFIKYAMAGNLTDGLELIEPVILLPDKKKIILPGSMH